MDANLLSNPLVIAGGLCALCVVGFILFFGLQFFGIIFEVLGTVIELIAGFITGGPGLWCGCLVTLFGLGGCALIVSLVGTTLQACGTVQATNLCSLFGR